MKNRSVFFKELIFYKEKNTYFIVNKIEEIFFVNFLACDNEMIKKGVYTPQGVMKDTLGQHYCFKNEEIFF